MYIYIYIYIHNPYIYIYISYILLTGIIYSTSVPRGLIPAATPPAPRPLSARPAPCAATAPTPQLVAIYIPQRGVQWKQGVVIYMMLYTSLLCNTTPL